MRRNIKITLLLLYVLFPTLAKGQHLDLKIKGGNHYETSIIDSVGYQHQFTSYQQLSHSVDTLVLKFQKMGYLDVQSIGLKKINDSLYRSNISLGQLYHSLKIYYHDLPLSQKTIKRLAVEFHSGYFSIPIPKTQAVLSFINQQIANQGRPFSFVQLQNIRKGKNGVLLADLISVSSKPREVDEIIVKGYEKFPVSFLKHFIGVKIGQAFNKERLEEKMERLHNLPFASSIKPPEVQFTRDSTTIYLYLEKEKSNTFEGFLGFSNDRDDNKLQLTGNVNVLLWNNLNYGESLNIHYKSSGDGQIKFNTALDLPYLFQTPIGLNVGLNIFKKDSSYVNIEQHVKINYQLNSQINTFIGFRHAESNSLLEKQAVTSGSVVQDYTANYLTLGGQYLDYNEFSELFPIKTTIGIDLSYGTRNHLGAANKQWMIHSDISYIFQLSRRNSLYVRNESSVLLSDTYLVNELFRFGGLHSIRGFTENSISASLYSASQTEYRYLLSSNLYINTIIDHAYYRNKVLGINENLYGLGFGFGLKTAAGILRINFANGKADGQNFEFENTKIHLGLVSNF